MENTRNISQRIIIKDVTEVILKPPKIDWRQTAKDLDNGFKLWFPINKGDASYGRRIICKNLKINREELICVKCQSPTNGDTREGYAFLLRKTLIKELNEDGETKNK
ncbi:MAG: hypothetical protein CO170_02670 [candidate division SR1 bacterium CG_4_9_14_3_um_filter_40_9]|nr:MAG: hypothetical protein AUJ54_11670 [Ignavibacteria bacterium CG1_02_37_35]PJA48466.1 MAG: hypothetical protein CO170_02670 [candidate division SR1 bacterium CG_4_9_14_3_um_filter_40_9]